MSASTAPSNLTDVLGTTRAFCVVCGKVSDDLELRGSGLKCKGCVGKRSNKHWVKLQKRQATQLLGEVAAPSTTRRALSGFSTSSPPPTNLSLMTPVSDDLSSRPSSRQLAQESSLGEPHKGKREAISEYITGTTVFQRALHHTHHSDPHHSGDGDDVAGEAEHGANERATQRCAPPPLQRTSPPPPHVPRRTPGGLEEFSASSEHSGVSSSLRTPATPPVGGPPLHRVGSKKMSASKRSSTTNGPVTSVVHSDDIHIPRSRPSVTSMTPQVITPSSKEPEARRSGSGLTEPEPMATPAADGSEGAATATGKAADTTAAGVSPTPSPHSTSLPTASLLSKRVDATAAASPPAGGAAQSPRARRLPQRPSPGCVVSIIEPERGGGGGGHQRVVSFSMQDGSATPWASAGATAQEDGSGGLAAVYSVDPQTEPPPAPVDNSRCASTASCSTARLPTRSPVTASNRSVPKEQAAAPAMDAPPSDDTTHTDEEGEAGAQDGDASSVSGSSSYVTNDSCIDAHHDTAHGRRRASETADDKCVEPSQPLVLNLDQLDLAVHFVSPAQLVAEADAHQRANGARNTTAPSSSSRVESAAASLSGSVSSNASTSSSSAQRRKMQVTVNGAFTVTRQLPGKELHRRTRSTDIGASRGHDKGAPSASAATDHCEVRRLQFRFAVKDRRTGAVLFDVDRGFFKEIMPALEAVRKVAGSSSGCPPLPTKTLPSFRYATEAYIEDRRRETEAVARFFVQDGFLVRHPMFVKLLLLDPAMHKDRRANVGVTERGADARGRSSGGGAGDAAGSQAKSRAGGTSAAPYLDSHSLDPLRQATAKGRGGSISSQASGHSSSRSSVVRRSRLDGVLTEDLERVQLGAVIGRGSFGTVCQGYLQTANGPVVVAVKRVHVNPSVTEDGHDTLGEAQSELDILRKAKHKNVVRFLGSLFSPTTMELSVFTEYVECGTLASMVERFGCLPLLAIQKYMKQILEGLRHLHQLSIVHRDIKGENVLVTKNGRVKLTDFGSSGVLNEVGAASVMPMGSPLWMAPEILHGDVAQAPGDVWAVGCVGIEMLDRPIWQTTANDAVNPFVFMYRIGKLGTPPQGLPTVEELEGFKARGEHEAFECFSLYRDFLVQCLQMKPEDRWTAEQLLRHPFIHTPFSRFIRWQLPATNTNDKA